MKLLRWLDKNFEYTMLAILLAILSVASFANVIMRYVFRNAISWSDEVCCYCLALSTFFSLPCWVRHRSGIRVDTVAALLPKKAQTVLNLLCNLLMTILMFLCMAGGVTLVQNAQKVNQKSPALQLPVAALYAIMTFCFLLTVFRYVQVSREDILSLKHGKEAEKA